MNNMNLPESSEEFQRAISAVINTLESKLTSNRDKLAMRRAICDLVTISDALGYVNTTLPYMAYYRTIDGTVFACDIDAQKHLGANEVSRISWDEYCATRASILSANHDTVVRNFDSPVHTKRHVYNEFLRAFINNNL